MFRSLKTLRSIPRIKDIALVLGKHGFHQVAGALQAPITTRLRRLFRQEPRHVIQQPERLRLVLEELGPTFIKFGQLLSTRPDMLPPAYIDELGKLQDKVHAAPFDEVLATLNQEFSGRLDALFQSVDPKPLAAASIAQVHRAVARSGEQVVVKVRKRGLERVVEQDLLVLGLLAEFLQGWPGLRLFNPEGIVRVFERSIRRELNFDYERSNLSRLRESLDADSTLRVPRPYPELSTSAVLTMEYLEGEQLSRLRQSELPPERREDIARRIAVAMFKQVFEVGFFHADPHPGNFLLMRDDEIGLIDLGNVGRVTPEIMDELVDLLVALVRRDYHRVARWILKQGQPMLDVSLEHLSMEVMDQLDHYYGLSLEEIRLGDLFNALFGMVLRYGISVPSQYVVVGRTFVTLEGTVRLCAPQLEVFAELQPYMLRVIAKRWAPSRLRREIEKQAVSLFTDLKSFPGNLAEALARAADGRLRIETHNPDLRRIEEKLDVMASKVPLALLIAALVLGASILLCLPGEDKGSLPGVLGISALALSGLLGLRFLLRG